MWYHCGTSVVLYCRIFRFDGISFGEAGSSKEGHRLTLGMGNYKNMALTRDQQTQFKHLDPEYNRLGIPLQDNWL